MSLVSVKDETWTVRAIDLTVLSVAKAEGGQSTERTDAEALARIGDTVFVFGSNFTDKSGTFDERRAFVARFAETSAVAGSASVEILELGTTLVDLVSTALASTGLLVADDDRAVINLEGAAFVGSDLWLGLRWPVSEHGQPLLVGLPGAGDVLADPLWSSEALRALDASAVVAVDVGASAKRPAGVRGMTVCEGTLHLVTGQTERGLAAKKVKAGRALHVQVDGSLDGPHAGSIEVQTFEGYRKVEGLAPMAHGRWLYSLDDEDAIVLLVGHVDP